MATLYISEFGQHNLNTIRLKQPAITDQTVAIGAGSAQSNAFSNNTYSVVLSTDAICSVLFGANPTATAAKLRLPAGFTGVFDVTPGHKVAVITNT